MLDKSMKMKRILWTNVCGRLIIKGNARPTIKALLQQWRLKGSNVSLNAVRRRTNFATLNSMATVTVKDSLKLRTLTKTRV